MHGRGLVIPPQLAHRPAISSSYVALFVDPWRVPGGGGLARLDRRTVDRLLAALRLDDPSGTPDLPSAREELARLLGPARAIDPRVAHVLRDLAGAHRIEDLAAEVGLSAPRLRALVRSEVGISLVHLRQWRRVGTAIANLPTFSVGAAAAVAGFADQAHFTRTTRRLVGRTPATIAGHHSRV
ncbi:MAG: helix-turn-helix domain-containing protein [Pseudonocardiaceae bacterium]|nr:helix-turn-helix domain-containing protein [Pseudonocardiaceae bacterium]